MATWKCSQCLEPNPDTRPTHVFKTTEVHFDGKEQPSTGFTLRVCSYCRWSSLQAAVPPALEDAIISVRDNMSPRALDNFKVTYDSLRGQKERLTVADFTDFLGHLSLPRDAIMALRGLLRDQLPPPEPLDAEEKHVDGDNSVRQWIQRHFQGSDRGKNTKNNEDTLTEVGPLEWILFMRAICRAVFIRFGHSSGDVLPDSADCMTPAGVRQLIAMLSADLPRGVSGVSNTSVLLAPLQESSKAAAVDSPLTPPALIRQTSVDAAQDLEDSMRRHGGNVPFEDFVLIISTLMRLNVEKGCSVRTSRRLSNLFKAYNMLVGSWAQAKTFSKWADRRARLIASWRDGLHLAFGGASVIVAECLEYVDDTTHFTILNEDIPVFMETPILLQNTAGDFQVVMYGNFVSDLQQTIQRQVGAPAHSQVIFAQTLGPNPLVKGYQVHEEDDEFFGEEDKPVIYVYSSKPLRVQVHLDFPRHTELICEPALHWDQTPPLPEDSTPRLPFVSQRRVGWAVTAGLKGDGSVRDERSGKSWPYLFWEQRLRNARKFETALAAPAERICLHYDQYENALSAMLQQRLLASHEIADFLEYWLPRLREFPYIVLRWLGDDSDLVCDSLKPSLDPYTASVFLSSRPSATRIVRVFMVWKGLQTPVEAAPARCDQWKAHSSHVPRSDREQEFLSLVEWGGMQL